MTRQLNIQADQKTVDSAGNPVDALPVRYWEDGELDERNVPIDALEYQQSLSGQPAKLYVGKSVVIDGVPRPVVPVRGVGWDSSGNIRTNGDSLMNGAYTFAVKTDLASLIPSKSHTNTAVGGSTMDDQLGYVLLEANAALLSRTTVWWDGSQNGITTVMAYVDLMAQGLAALGHNYFVVIPPINPFGVTYAGSQAEAIAAEMLARWPSNFLHWNTFLPNTAGAIDAGEFHDPGVDNYHLSAAGTAHAARGIYDFLLGKGWIDGDVADPMLSSGSMWLFDPSLDEGAFVGVPANASVKPNVAWEKAAAVLGGGNATTLGTYAAVVNTNGGADVLAERTPKGALHAILSQNSAYVGGSNQGIIIEPNAAIQTYLDQHVDDDWFFSVWFKVTRKPLTNPPGGDPAVNSALQSVMHKAQNTSAYLFHMQNLDIAPASGTLGESNLPSAQIYSGVTLGEPLLRSVGTSAYTGTKPALGGGGLASQQYGLHVALGSFDAWGYYNNGAAPSIALYRAYAENLTVSGRTYAQVAGIDRVLFAAAFAPTGGAFSGDSYTDPATFP